MIISKVIDISCNGRRMFYEIAISLISSLILKMALYVLGYWVGIHFYSMVPQFSTVYFVFSQIWN